MDALIEDIDAFLEDRPVGARDYALLYSAGKFLHRNQTLVASVALGLLIVITATVVFTVRLARARDAAALARDQALAEAVRSLRMQHFTESLFTGGASYGFPPPGIKVAQMLNRGRDEAIQIIGDPRLQAAMFQSLGTSYNSLGYYSGRRVAAQESARRSLRIWPAASVCRHRGVSCRGTVRARLLCGGFADGQGFTPH